MLTLPERRFALWNWTARTFSTSVAERILSERFLSREPLRRFCGASDVGVEEWKALCRVCDTVSGTGIRQSVSSC